jgi:hypothetical protein
LEFQLKKNPRKLIFGGRCFCVFFFSLFFLGRGFFAGDGGDVGDRSCNADYGFYGEVFSANGVGISGISAAAGTGRQRKAGWHVACLLRT